MNKFLVHNESEYLKLFNSFELHDKERFLGVEFAFEDGTYPSDSDDDDDDDDDKEVSEVIFRKFGDACFPEHYPCVVLLANERSFDRTGDVCFEMLDFVYLSDFEVSRDSTERIKLRDCFIQEP